MSYGRYTMPMGLPAKKKNREKRAGTRLVCRVCHYGSVTLHKEPDGRMICSECRDLLNKRKR